jgi:hypothetical protein
VVEQNYLICGKRKRKRKRKRWGPIILFEGMPQLPENLSLDPTS